jgi:hypothetical protein
MARKGESQRNVVLAVGKKIRARKFNLDCHRENAAGREMSRENPAANSAGGLHITRPVRAKSRRLSAS